jgi:hypothetical protein
MSVAAGPPLRRQSGAVQRDSKAVSSHDRWPGPWDTRRLHESWVPLGISQWSGRGSQNRGVPQLRCRVGQGRNAALFTTRAFSLATRASATSFVR